MNWMFNFVECPHCYERWGIGTYFFRFARWSIFVDTVRGLGRLLASSLVMGKSSVLAMALALGFMSVNNKGDRRLSSPLFFMMAHRR